MVLDAKRPVLGRLLLTAGAAAVACAFAPAAFAQAGAVSQPVVQALPNRNSLTLNQALARLGQNPRDIGALIDAGNAALAMGDVEASVGFFRRADQIAPGNAQVKAGLAGALVHSENPFDAIPMFEEAERAGAGEGTLAGERGLAYDLVGDNEKAQRFYRQALAKEMDDEILRRFALSYAIAGDRKQSEAILTPLLQRQDKAAWRTRAFSLAILGQVDEAVSIANSTLPPSLASGISPYLRYMPRLTAAQQAAAANLGHFPRASEIGRDDPRVALYAPKTPRRPAQVASADTALTPRGQPLGRSEKARTEKSRSERARDERRASSDSRSDRRSRSETALAANTTNATSWRNGPSTSLTAPRRPATAAPAPTPTPSSARPAQSAAARPTTPAPTVPPRTAALAPTVSRPVAAAALPPPLTPSRTTSTSTAMATPLAATPRLSAAVQGPPAPVQGPPAPSSLAAITQSPTPTPTPTPAPATFAAAPTPTLAPAAAPVTPTPAAAALTPAPTPAPAPAPVKVNIADAFSDFLKPTIDVAPAEGAVDVRRLAPSRQAAETKTTQGKAAATAAKPAKPPPPSHPSRIWVQVATGRDKAALAFDWRKMNREKAAVLRGKSAFISAWGQTNRLLTGPFPTEAAANAFIAQLRRADVDGAFLWNSPAGQVVDPIAGK